MKLPVILAVLLLGAAVSPAFAQSASSWELCPQPSEALSAVPNDIDQIQADIDRFTLCLNRAELLLKLEDLKSQNGVGQMASASAGGMNLPINPPPLTEAQAAQVMGPDGGNAAPTDTVIAAPKDAPPEKGYAIREVRGLGGILVARVQSPDGNYEQVKVGDKLADGSEVTAITSTQVTVQKSGAVKRLGWED